MRPRFPDTPLTTREALARGFTHNQLTTLVSEGVLRRPFTGVYVRSDLPDSVSLRAAAARLVMSPHSVLCDRTAAWLHGVDVFRYAELETVPRLESYVLRGHDPTDRRECRGGTRDLLPDDYQLLGGIRVTTPLRTAVDLGCSQSAPPGGARGDGRPGSRVRCHGERDEPPAPPISTAPRCERRCSESLDVRAARRTSGPWSPFPLRPAQLNGEPSPTQPLSGRPRRRHGPRWGPGRGRRP